MNPFHHNNDMNVGDEPPSDPKPVPCPNCKVVNPTNGSSNHAPLFPKIVKKEGPNKGRSFVSCDICSYFTFVDSSGNPEPKNYKKKAYYQPLPAQGHRYGPPKSDPVTIPPRPDLPPARILPGTETAKIQILKRPYEDRLDDLEAKLANVKARLDLITKDLHNVWYCLNEPDNTYKEAVSKSNPTAPLKKIKVKRYNSEDEVGSDDSTDEDEKTPGDKPACK